MRDRTLDGPPKRLFFQVNATRRSASRFLLVLARRRRSAEDEQLRAREAVRFCMVLKKGAAPRARAHAWKEGRRCRGFLEALSLGLAPAASRGSAKRPSPSQASIGLALAAQLRSEQTKPQLSINARPQKIAVQRFLRVGRWVKSSGKNPTLFLGLPFAFLRHPRRVHRRQSGPFG